MLFRQVVTFELRPEWRERDSRGCVREMILDGLANVNPEGSRLVCWRDRKTASVVRVSEGKTVIESWADGPGQITQALGVLLIEGETDGEY